MNFVDGIVIVIAVVYVFLKKICDLVANKWKELKLSANYIVMIVQ